MFTEIPFDKVHTLVTIALEKVASAKKSRRDFKRKFREDVNTISSKFARDYLRLMREEVESNLSKMRKSTPKKMVDSLADWDELMEIGEIMLKELTLALLADGGELAFKAVLRKQDRFDPLHEEATKYAQTHSAVAIVEITKTTMEGIEAVIIEGIKERLTIQQIAKNIKPIINLTDKQALSVGRNLTKLLEAGVPEEKALRMAQRHARRLHRVRVETIARTETANSLNEGLRQGYSQLGVKKLQRVEDGDSPDEPCQINNGRIYTIAEASGVLPEHPNCEGSWVAA
jgi:hypothetical protein